MVPGAVSPDAILAPPRGLLDQSACHQAPNPHESPRAGPGACQRPPICAAQRIRRRIPKPATLAVQAPCASEQPKRGRHKEQNKSKEPTKNELPSDETWFIRTRLVIFTGTFGSVRRGATFARLRMQAQLYSLRASATRLTGKHWAAPYASLLLPRSRARARCGVGAFAPAPTAHVLASR
jgi:hypothetical protein